MNALLTLKCFALASGMGLMCASACAAVTPATIIEKVDLTRRDVVLKNTITGANETIRMWTFSPGGSFGFGGGNGGFNDPNAPFPGPLLVFRASDNVEYTFNDTCPCEQRSSSHPYAGHTIHLHGLDVNTLDDGVHDTSFSILPGQSYAYKMSARENGSFIYHCHIHTVLHQQMGMYGGIIVTPADSNDQDKPFTGSPTTFARQYMWVIAEVDKSWHDKAASGNFGDSAEFAYFTQYNPQHFFIANYFIDVANLKSSNGILGRGVVKTSANNLAGKTGETLLIRLGNLGYWNKKVSLGGLKFDVVATDGKPMKNTSGALDPMIDQTSIEAGPGERYDLMVTLPTTAGAYTAKIEFLEPQNKAVKGTLNQTINVCSGTPASANAC